MTAWIINLVLDDSLYTIAGCVTRWAVFCLALHQPRQNNVQLVQLYHNSPHFTISRCMVHGSFYFPIYVLLLFLFSCFICAI